MATRTRAPKAPVQEPAEVQPVSLSKKTAAERLAEVLLVIDRQTSKPVTDPESVKWGKAIALAGGGSVYINRGNADVRSTTKQVADWSKAGLGTVRGPQGQYLRIKF